MARKGSQVRESSDSKSARPFDVLIAGAGPAGATAAILLAQRGRRVALVDRARFPRAAFCSGWISPKVAPLLKQICLGETLLTNPILEVTFYRADFTKSAKPQSKDPFGFLIDRSKFDDSLVKKAVACGAELFVESSVENCVLKEAEVTLQLADDRKLDGRLLIVAAGRNTPLLEKVGLDRSDSGLWTVQVEAQSSGKAASKSPRVAVVLGVSTDGSFGLFCTVGHRVSAGLQWYGVRDRARPTLASLCRLAHANGVLPLDLSDQAAEAPLVRSPAAAALDMESHVGKHSLVIGDAGGFVSAASNEGIYPAMWSARIAAEVIDKALSAPRSQDELISFDSAWRMEMADHLRAPHSDIQFLLPLIFTNQPMADRMAAAFFRGENI